MLMATSIGYNFVALVATLGDQYLQPMGEASLWWPKFILTNGRWRHIVGKFVNNSSGAKKW